MPHRKVNNSNMMNAQPRDNTVSPNYYNTNQYDAEDYIDGDDYEFVGNSQ